MKPMRQSGRREYDAARLHRTVVVANPNYGHSNPYTVYDAAVHYDLGRMNNSLKGVSVSVNANNVFDKEYISTCDGFYCYYGDRRSVLASVDYKW